VAAGFATHPHWDHLLWHADFGAVPRYGTEKCVVTARANALDARTKAQRLAPGVPVELIGLLTPLASGAALVPWDGPDVQIIEHDAHAPGHPRWSHTPAWSWPATCFPTSKYRCWTTRALAQEILSAIMRSDSAGSPPHSRAQTSPSSRGTEASPAATTRTRESSPTRTISKIFDRVGPRPIHGLVPPRHVDPTGCNANMNYSVRLSGLRPPRSAVEDSTGQLRAMITIVPQTIHRRTRTHTLGGMSECPILCCRVCAALCRHG